MGLSLEDKNEGSVGLKFCGAAYTSRVRNVGRSNHGPPAKFDRS